MINRSGKLKHKVTLWKPSVSVSTEGVPTKEPFTNEGERKAAIEPLNGREFFQSQQEGQAIQTRITLYSDSLTRQITGQWELTANIYIDKDTVKTERYKVQAPLAIKNDYREIVLMCSNVN